MLSSKSVVSIALKGAVGLWPAIAVAAIFGVLQASSGSSSELLNASLWPSAFDLSACLQKKLSTNCSGIASLDNTIRMLSLCAAILPVLNYVDHTIAVLSVYRRLDKQGIAWSYNISSVAIWLMAVVLICNGIWIISIREDKFSTESNNEEYATAIMFCLLAFIDLMLVIIHFADKSIEGEFERDYFLGSLLFIDVPTIFGILETREILNPAISLNFGTAQLPIAQAMFGESVVMHIALAQIVLVFLHIQRIVRRELAGRKVKAYGSLKLAGSAAGHAHQ